MLPTCVNDAAHLLRSSVCEAGSVASTCMGGMLTENCVAQTFIRSDCKHKTGGGKPGLRACSRRCICSTVMQKFFLSDERILRCMACTVGGLSVWVWVCLRCQHAGRLSEFEKRLPRVEAACLRPSPSHTRCAWLMRPNVIFAVCASLAAHASHECAACCLLTVFREHPTVPHGTHARTP